MGNILGGFPAIFTIPIALPFDKVLKLAPEDPAVKNFFDLVFLLAFDHDRWRWQRLGTIGVLWAQPVDMNDIVDLEPVGERETIA